MRPSKSKLSLERQCWKNEQYTRRECIEVVGIPDTTNETKVCDLIEVATSISITPDSLEANDKVIIKFSRRKDAEMVLSKKNKAKGFNLAVLVLKVVKSLSMKAFAATIRSYGVNAKLYGQRSGLKLSGLAMTK